MSQEQRFRDKLDEIQMQKDTLRAIFSEGDADPVLFDEMFNYYLGMVDWLEVNSEALFNGVTNEMIIMNVVTETEVGNRLKKAYLDKYQTGKVTLRNFLNEVLTAFGETEEPAPGASQRSGMRPNQGGSAFQPNPNRNFSQGSEMNEDTDPDLDAEMANLPQARSNVTPPLNQNINALQTSTAGRSNIQPLNQLEGIRESSAHQRERPLENSQRQTQENRTPQRNLDNSRRLAEQTPQDSSSLNRPAGNNTNAGGNNRQISDEMRSRVIAEIGQRDNTRLINTAPLPTDKPREVNEHFNPGQKNSIPERQLGAGLQLSKTPKYSEFEEYDYLGRVVPTHNAGRFRTEDINNEGVQNDHRIIDTNSRSHFSKEDIGHAKSQARARMDAAQKDHDDLNVLISEQIERELKMREYLKIHKETAVQADLKRRRTELELENCKKEKVTLLREVENLTKQSNSLEQEIEYLRKNLQGKESSELRSLKEKKGKLVEDNHSSDLELSKIKQEIEDLYWQMKQDGLNPPPMPFFEAQSDIGRGPTHDHHSDIGQHSSNKFRGTQSSFNAPPFQHNYLKPNNYY